MVQSYLGALEQGAQPSPKIEKLIPEPPLPGLAAVGEAILACFAFAQSNQRLEMVDACLKTVEPKALHPMLATPLQLAQGALLFRQGKKAEALPLLQGSKQMMGRVPTQALMLGSLKGWSASGKPHKLATHLKSFMSNTPSTTDSTKALKAVEQVLPLSGGAR